MDRETDLTLEALIARESDSREGLDHFYKSRIDRDGYGMIGIHRKNAHIERRFSSIIIASEPDETRETLESFETYQTWLVSFGCPHPAHMKIDPYLFMWMDGINCDCCGTLITPLNKPKPMYGICSECTIEMNQEKKDK